MTTIHQLKDSFEGNQRIAFVKGSPKEVMELCNRCFKGSKEMCIRDSSNRLLPKKSANDKEI